MNALLVGADRLGNIPDVLAEFGIRIGGHITGRQPGHQKRATVPAGTQLVILFTDFLGHNVMRSFRDTARAQGLPVVCCRRSTSSLRQTIAASIGQRATPEPGQRSGPAYSATLRAPSNRFAQ